MDKQQGSHTAIGAAIFRAAHQLLDDGEKLLRDEPILKLLTKADIDHIYDRSEDFFIPGSIAMRTHMMLRSRYAEDCLYESYWRGVRQYLLLGAGVDTFAWRQPEWAKDLHIIEADQPASQATKLRLLQRAQLPNPHNLSFFGIDLENEDLPTAFANSPLNLTKPVFISCLGVLIYLHRETVTRIFRFLGSLPKGSEFVFTASTRRWDPFFIFSAVRVAKAGEPWRTFFTPISLTQELKACGFSRVDWLTPEEAAKRYWHNSSISLPPPKNSSLVRAVV